MIYLSNGFCAHEMLMYGGDMHGSVPSLSYGMSLSPRAGSALFGERVD